MYKKGYLIALLVILGLFTFGLVGFYIFSAGLGDGLEKTMEDAGVEEGESAYKAPFDYGNNYTSTWIMGFLGFAATLVVGGLMFFGLGKKNGPGKR